MIKHKNIEIIAALFMAVSLLLLGVVYFYPSIFKDITGSANPPYVTAMDKTAILDIHIIADEKSWANMLENATAEEIGRASCRERV